MCKIDIVLVNPNDKKRVYGSLGPSLSGIEPPIWTGLIASFLRTKGVSVKIIDAVAEGWDNAQTVIKVEEYDPLFVGIGVLGANPSASSTPKMPAASELLQLLKENHVLAKTVIYGIHPSALAEETLRNDQPDFLCKGESFYTLLDLIKQLKSDNNVAEYKISGLWYLKDNAVVSNGWGRLVDDLDELPFVAWDLLPMDKYRAHNWHCFGHLDQRHSYAIVYSSLGCPFSCTYCNVKALYNGKAGIRFRSLSKVVEEIDFLVANYGIKNIKIFDELFALKEDRVFEFCRLMIDRDYKVNMWAYARIDTVNDQMLKMMKKAGINWLAYGIEAGSKKVREGVVKGKFDHDRISQVIKMTHDVGINVIGNFMFGLPDDDLDTMQETLDLAMELKCEYVNFYTTMAYPGSVLYEELAGKEGYVSNNWLEYSQFSTETRPLPTKYVSSKDVLSIRDKAFNEYFSNLNYLSMVEEKFGKETADHIKEMLKLKIKRKILQECV